MPIGFSLHFCVAFTMGVGPFFLSTLAWYPCYFTSEELRAIARRLRLVPGDAPEPRAEAEAEPAT